MVNLDLLVDVDCNDTDTLKPYAQHLCSLFVESWSKVDANELELKRMPGGQENYTFLCSVNKEKNSDFEGPFKLIMKIHGANKRIKKHMIFKDNLVTSVMSALKMGPHVHGVFDLGRVEHFIPCLPLTQEEMKVPNHGVGLARKIAAFHFLNFPFAKQPEAYYNQLNADLEAIYNQKFETPDEYHEKYINFNIKHEFNELLKFAKSLKSPVVFCHNDIFFGNILKLKDNDLMLIDYEDSSYNYRGYDIGAYFSSFMFNSVNNDSYPYFSYYQDAFPNQDDQVTFVNAYIDEYKKRVNKESKESEELLENLNTDQLLLEGRTFACLFHLGSGIWGKTYASITKDDYGFKDWAIKRCEAYFHLKNMFFKDGFKK